MKQGRNDHMRRPLLAYESLHWLVALAFTGLAALLADRLETSWFEAALIVATGALAGYLTSDMAITILLWPTEPKLGGMLQGFLFKRRDVFGNTLIDRSCEKFLNSELFTKLIQDPAVEEALHSSVRSAIIDLASRDLGTPRSFLSEVLPEREHSEELFDRIAAALGNHAAKLLFDNSSEERIFNLLQVGMDYVGLTRVQWLGDPAKSALAIEHMLAECFTADVVEALSEWAVKRICGPLNSSSLLGELVPDYAKKQIGEIFRTYALMVILKEINSFLLDEKSRARIVPLVAKELERLIRSEIGSLSGLRAWILKTFGMKNMNEILETLPAKIDGFLRKTPEFLVRPEFIEYFGTAIDKLIVGLWNLRLKDLHPMMPAYFVRYLMTAATEPLRSEIVRKELTAELVGFLSRFEDRELKTLVPAFFDDGKLRDRIVRFVSTEMAHILADPETRSKAYTQSRILTRGLVVSFLDAPLPRLIDLPFVKLRGVETLAVSAGNIVTDKLREYGPHLVERFPIRERLQDLWNAMTNEQMQESILGVMEDQFKILINLGISYGATVGFLSLILQGVSGTNGTIVVWTILITTYRIFKYKVVEQR